MRAWIAVLLLTLLFAACEGSDPQSGEPPSLPGSCDVEGESRSCYPGDPAQAGVGPCQEGTSVCTGGQWAPCQGFVEPAPEQCDDAGIDESCDGVVNEGCPCTTGSTQPCYGGNPITLDIGPCREGEQRCVDEQWSFECQGQVTPATEACDEADNDCDGATDEGCACVDGTVRGCYGGPDGTMAVGPCRQGQQLCQDGVWSAECEGEVLPTAEQCNEEDDDCDGSVDENNPEGGAECSTGADGVCAPGKETCSDGELQCLPNEAPSPEVCDNGLDDDCDGEADCGYDDDCDGEPAPVTLFGEDSCRCTASLPTCDKSVSCGDCLYFKDNHYWCRKVDGVWQWHVAFDPTDGGSCLGFDCTVACCETSDFWCNQGKWDEGLPGVECPAYPPSYSCS